MPEDTPHLLQLWFVIQDEYKPFVVTAPANAIIYELKKLVKEESNVLHGIHAKYLVLWKLNEPEPVDPDDELAERIQRRGTDFRKFAKTLSAAMKLSDVFPQQPSLNHLYLIVHAQHPSTVSMSPSSSAESNRSHDKGDDPGVPAPSVVIPGTLGTWTMLPEHDPYHQFWRKYWGKSILVEASEQFNAQGDNNENYMDVDFEEGTDEVDIDGCFQLDIAIPLFPIQSLWVRADYMRIYDYLQNWYDEITSKSQIPGAVLTGQPGIGKSVWLYYALRRRLGGEQTTILHKLTGNLLFTTEGVFIIPRRFRFIGFRDIVWTLVDSESAMDGVPPVLIDTDARLFVIYSTSPDRHRWSRFHKVKHQIVVLMNPWTKKEILRVASLQLGQSADLANIGEIYNRLGPTPRLCIKYASDKLVLAEYKHAVDQAVFETTAQSLKNMVREATHLRMDAVSHKICLVRRKCRDDVHSIAIVGPVTQSIQSRMANQAKKLARAERIQLYEYFMKVPGSRGTAGIFFEAEGQMSLQDGITLNLFPMMQLPSNDEGGSGSSKLPQWYSSHILFRNPKREERRQDALKNCIFVEIKPSEIVEYGDNGPESVKYNVLYIPLADNQEALDSFILLDKLYIFQFTIGESHEIKPGLLPFLGTRNGIPSMDQWRFVFIIPPNHTLICPQPWKLEMRKLRPYTAVITLEL